MVDDTAGCLGCGRFGSTQGLGMGSDAAAAAISSVSVAFSARAGCPIFKSALPRMAWIFLAVSLCVAENANRLSILRSFRLVHFSTLWMSDEISDGKTGPAGAVFGWAGTGS